MSLIEAAKAALAALEHSVLKGQEQSNAIAGLRASIGEAERAEPVAWIASNKSPVTSYEYRKLYFTKSNFRTDWVKGWTPLYTHPASTVPEGWQLVPKEPTEAMIVAWLEHCERGTFQEPYKAMLASAPEYKPCPQP